MKLDLEQMARDAGADEVVPGEFAFNRANMEAFAKAVAVKCAEFCRDEAALRREGGLTFPLERNPPYIRGQTRGATACAVRIEEEFGINTYGGPNG